MSEINTAYVLECCQRHPHVVDTVRSVEVQPKAILASEMLAFCVVAVDQGVTCVVESGRAYGYSTRVLSQFFEVHSLESAPLEVEDRKLRECGFDRLRLYQGDGNTQVPSLVKGSHNSGNRTALLLDGPKGIEAIALGHSLRDHLVMFAVHDLYPMSEGNQANGAHKYAIEHDVWFAECKEWLEKYAELDDSWWMGAYASRGDMTSNSFQIGLFAGEEFK